MHKLFLLTVLAIISTSPLISQTYGNNQYEMSGSDRYSNPVDDQKIAQKVGDQLKGGWFSKGYSDVSFFVMNGNVELRGDVEKLEDRRKIEDSIRKIDGVRNVYNNIVVLTKPEELTNPKDEASNRKDDKNGYSQDRFSSPSDRQIAKDIRDSLSGWFSKNPENLAIFVDNGNVMIRGSVLTIKERENINEKLKGIEGVRTISNQLQIRSRDAVNN